MKDLSPEYIEKLLMSADVDIYARDSYGSSAIHQAARQGHTEITKLLVEAGIDINDRDNFNQTVAHITTSLQTFKVRRKETCYGVVKN